MIKIDTNTVEIKGTKLDLLLEITVFLHSAKAKGIFDDRDIQEICRIACLSEEEIGKSARDARSAIAMVALLNSLFGEKED